RGREWRPARCTAQAGGVRDGADGDWTCFPYAGMGRAGAGPRGTGMGMRGAAGVRGAPGNRMRLPVGGGLNVRAGAVGSGSSLEERPGAWICPGPGTPPSKVGVVHDNDRDSYLQRVRL